MRIKANVALCGVLLAFTCGLSSLLPVHSMESGIHLAAANKLKGKVSRDMVEADDLMAKGDWDKAADAYKNVMNKDSKNSAAFAGYGMALAKQFKLDGAEEQLDRALQIDPTNAVAHVGRALVLMNRLQSSNMTIRQQRDSMLKQAENECRTALQKDPFSPEAHYQLAQSLRDQGRLDEAAREYNEAIKSDPKYSEAFAGLGMTKLAMNSLGEAESAFKQAVQYNSGNSGAHYGLGKTYLKMGNVDAAIKELNTSLYQNPNSYPAHLAMGEAYQAQGNNNAAINEYKKSVLIKPENADAYLHVADIREGRGDIELSISELRGALELMPDNPDLHLRIADESLQLEKVDDAMKEYQTVMNTNPGNAQAAKGLTRAYFLKAQKETGGAFFVSNDFESAKAQIQKAIQLNPNDMELRLAMAKIRSMSGETVDLNSIGTPRTDGERVAYAEALLAQNRFKEAQDQMNMVIANANDPKQIFSVGDLALMIKDLDDADAAYRKAATMPGGEERAKRGQDMVKKARETARQDLTLADDLARKKQLASAIDKYHASVFENPRVPEARMGLANALERLSPAAANDLREASVQLKAYLSLRPDLPPKEVEKVQKRITKLEEKAYKIDQKAKKNK
ncbi:MAG: tetratricopeptide repeat protein [Candidatus Obscuribacterales bacterium]|nr:tetratricopeptide repeat protein [Candidatus Obscuribacterales bacterium]